MRLHQLGSCFGIAALLPLAPAAAQTIRGSIVEETTGAPVDGAIVRLLAPDSTRLMSTLSDDRGRFVLRAPMAGRYIVRAERIGLRATMSPPLTLAAGEIRNFTMAARPIPVTMPEVTVAAGARCAAQSDDGAAARLWEEARKALEATSISQRDRLLTVSISQFERRLDARSGAVREEQRWDRSGVSDNPFRSVAPERLQRDGYVQRVDDGFVYYAPDARTLLSDAFLGGHCLSPRLGTGDRAGLVGLGFTPVPERRLPDVEGVLWTDARTLELRFVEFGYVLIPLDVPTGKLGGRVDYRRLPTGAWLVQRWNIRMPIVREVRSTPSATFAGASPTMMEIIALQETGGEVMTASTADGRQLFDAGSGTLAGTVYDSLGRTPLPGARVRLEGTSFWTTTDTAGRFTIAGLPDATYTIRVSHPRLDSARLTLESAPIGVRRGEIATAAVAVPPLTPTGVLASLPAAGSMTPGAADSGAVAARPDGAGSPGSLAQGGAARTATVKPATADPVRGFEQRRSSGIGRFFTRADIERRGARQLSDILRAIPGLRVSAEGSDELDAPEHALAAAQGQSARSGGAPGGGAGGQGTPLRGSAADSARGADQSAYLLQRLQNRACSADVFLNGLPFIPGPGGLDRDFRIEDIEAVEVYTTGTVPAQFTTRGSECGTVIIWTVRPAGGAR